MYYLVKLFLTIRFYHILLNDLLIYTSIRRTIKIKYLFINNNFGTFGIQVHKSIKLKFIDNKTLIQIKLSLFYLCSKKGK